MLRQRQPSTDSPTATHNTDPMQPTPSANNSPLLKVLLYAVASAISLALLARLWATSSAGSSTISTLTGLGGSSTVLGPAHVVLKTFEGDPNNGTLVVSFYAGRDPADLSARPISPWHDIVYSAGSIASAVGGPPTPVYRFVCEVPKFTRVKLEVRYVLEYLYM